MRAMVEEMFFLANQGVEIFRLDAVPFIWKRLGTNCENLPEAHTILRALQRDDQGRGALCSVQIGSHRSSR